MSDEGQPVRVDIGAGSKRTNGWIALGLDPEHDIQCDIRTLACPDRYADEMRAIHVIEHIHFLEVPAMLREWLRVLKPGGTIAIECPDLIKSCKNVVDNAKDVKNGLRAIYGDITCDDERMRHKWLPTPDHMRELLAEAGFIKIKEESPQYHGRRTYRDLRFVARKPSA